MSQTNITTLANQVQKFWSSLFMEELRTSVLLPSLVNKDYQGQIQKGGDTVRVSQINAPKGENRTIGTDADSFQSEQLSTSYVDIKADKRAIASFQFDDLTQLQSQIDGAANPEIRTAMMYAIGKQMSDYLYSLSTTQSANKVNSKANFVAADLLAARLLAAKGKWRTDKPWYCLVDPAYNNDLLGAQTMVNRDYTGQDDVPTIAGKIVNKRFGFDIIEDNGLAASQAFMFSPDYLHLVMQKEVEFKISDLHPQGKFGFVISANVIYGAKLGIDGAKKCAVTTAAASGATPVTL